MSHTARLARLERLLRPPARVWVFRLFRGEPSPAQRAMVGPHDDVVLVRRLNRDLDGRILEGSHAASEATSGAWS
jgi:hypothetical protein